MKGPRAISRPLFRLVIRPPASRSRDLLPSALEPTVAASLDPSHSGRTVMSDPKSESHEAVEADDMGERPDLGRTPDALVDALTGTGVGSDTRAGSLEHSDFATFASASFVEL